MPTLPELQLQLQALRDEVPGMLRETPDRGAFFGRFAGAANAILARAPPHLGSSVYCELSFILRDLELGDYEED